MSYPHVIEALVPVCAAPNPNGPASDCLAVDCTRHPPQLWHHPVQQSALSDPRRRFDELATTTIVCADIVAWVGDGCASGADKATAAVNGLLDLLQSIYRMRSR